jgi:hypothetical protein
MKIRLPEPVAARGAWRAAGTAAAGAVLLAVAVSACSGGTSVPSSFTPVPQTSGQSASPGQSAAPGPSATPGRSSSPGREGTRTPSPTNDAANATRTRTSSPAGTHTTATPHVSQSATRTLIPTAAVTTETRAATPTARVSAAHTSAAATPPFPTAPPQTGGGGTAGLQDSLLFGIGGAAVLAGLGSLAYRRRLARKFGADADAPVSPADREPADR